MKVYNVVDALEVLLILIKRDLVMMLHRILVCTRIIILPSLIVTYLKNIFFFLIVDCSAMSETVIDLTIF